MNKPETDKRYHNSPHDGPAEPRTQDRPPLPSIALWGLIAGITFLALLMIIGAWQRVSQRRAQKEFTARTTQVEVSVVPALRDGNPKDLILPGTFQAFEEATIFPRTNGYVKSWKVDIGDNVKTGQLLAEIQAPEVDQQTAQARANYELAKVTADRWKDLLAKNVVSKQEYDQNEKGYEASEANFHQLQQIQGFDQVIAPFDGKITTRTIDVGTLVTAGTGNSGTPLFTIMQSDPLRVYVFVPQTNAGSIHEGLKAKILLQELPGEEFEGTVTRTAGALDPQSRSMQVEVQVPNHEGRLYAGMYGQVKFLLPDDHAPLLVPANAFLFHSDGAQVVTVADGNRIHFQKISVGRDFGTKLEVVDGLTENANVVMNPTDDLVEGRQVQVKATDQKSTAPSAQVVEK